MRLTRLFALAGAAYVGYLVYRDMQERIASHGHSEGGLLEEALNQEIGRMQTLTGHGRGETESIADVSGGVRNVKVGRGVTE